MTLQRRRVVVAGAALVAAAHVPAQTPGAVHTLLPGQSLQQLVRNARDGDRIDIVAGAHRGQVAVIEHHRLALRGVGGRPVLHADGRDAEGKAMLVVRGGDITVDNIEFRGARVADRNGAGIRFERGRLVLTRCAFFDNENGLLAGNDAAAELQLIDCDFGAAPAATPLPHLVYVGRIARFTLHGCRVAGGRDGHLVKTRARANHILYNQLVDGAEGRASYELEFPNGGLAFVVGNVIGKGRDSSNAVLLSYGSEGPVDDREHGLFMAHNTLVNAGLKPAVFVRVAALPQPAAQRFVNNLMVGLGVAELALADATQGNVTVPAAALVDADTGAYALAAGSWLRDRGVAPGSARGMSLVPQAEFTPPVGTRSIAARDRWSPGAYQG